MTTRMTTRATIVAAALLLANAALGADTPVPASDVTKAKDPAYLGRYGGAIQLSHNVADFDALVLPTGQLKPVQGQRDSSNNQVFAPEKKVELEGKRSHWVYLLPEGTSTLAAIRNYQNVARGKGGKVLFECQGVECGGGQRNLSYGGGGQQGVAMVLWPNEKITDKRSSPGYCALRGGLKEQRFTALEVPSSRAHVAVLAFIAAPGAECKGFDNRTFVMVDAVESQAMAQTMEVPSADEMVASITTSGRVALYGIHFDSGKTEVKQESKATMDEIGKLLAANKTLKLLVVGHTDNVGGFTPNVDLSRKRAEAVVAQLVSQYRIPAARLQAFGVAYASPVAPNIDEPGRARNRRVELVANN
jgi:OOP family OmpA-OmpF porin